MLTSGGLPEAKQLLPGLVVLLSLATGLVLLYGRIDYTAPQYAEADLWAYRRIAECAPAICEDVGQPYVFRILWPYVVGLLPLPVDWAFYFIAISASLLLLATFFAWLQATGTSLGVALIVTVLFGANKWFFGFTLWDYFQVNDVISLVLLVLLFWSMGVGNLPAFSVLLVIGAVTRETTLLAVPTALAFALQQRRPLSPWALAAAPAAAAFLILRLSITPAGGPGLVEAFLQHSPKLVRSDALPRLLVNAFIPLSLVPLIFWRTTLGFFRQNTHLLLYAAMVFGSTLFGTDNERLMAPAFVVFYPLIARILEHNVWTPGFRGSLVVVLTLTGAFLAMFHYNMGWQPLPTRMLYVVASLAALTVVTGVLWFHRLAPPSRSTDT